MKKYHVHIPNWAHSMTCYGYNSNDAVVRFKKQHGINRMPNGYKIWEAV